MAFDFVTSRQGKPHVTAEQAGALNLSIFGKGRFVTDYADELAVTMASANQVNIATGGLIVDGRFLINEKPETVAIANGTQNQWRKDLIILKINVDASTGIGSVSLSSIQGTPAATEAAAKDPVFTPGDLSKGGHQAQVAIARVTLDGLKPSVSLILPTAKSLGGNDFELFAVQDVETGSTYKNYWHVWRTGNSVTVQFYGWFNGKSKYDAKQCPFLIPEGSRPPAVDGSLYPFDDHEHIYYSQIICPEHPDVLTVLSARPDGKIYVQDMGGALSDAWRMGTLTYTVAH